MTIGSYVIDSTNGQPVDGASIEVIDGDGNFLGKGTVAGVDGGFQFTSSLLDTPGNKIRVTAVGFDPQEILPKYLGDEIGMLPGGDLESVTFVQYIKKKLPKAKYTLPIIVGSVSVALLSWGLWMKSHK